MSETTSATSPSGSTKWSLISGSSLGAASRRSSFTRRSRSHHISPLGAGVWIAHHAEHIVQRQQTGGGPALLHLVFLALPLRPSDFGPATALFFKSIVCFSGFCG